MNEMGRTCSTHGTGKKSVWEIKGESESFCKESIMVYLKGWRNWVRARNLLSV
jgi:hypothetical protein